MEDYARELSIRYANSDESETNQRLKKAAEEYMKENKKLQKKLDGMEKKGVSSVKEKAFVSKIEKLESSALLTFRGND